MKRGYVYRLKPNKQQAELINKTVGCARLTYNLLLEDYKQQLENGLKPKVKEVSYFKSLKGKEFLNDVDSLALANAKVHFKKALSEFYKSKNGKRKGKRVGFPKKHKKNKTKLSYTTNMVNGNIVVEGDMIKLPKLGFVRFIKHRELEGMIKSCTIEQTRDGNYYISILTEQPDRYGGRNPEFNELKVVGIDMSLSSFSVDSEGERSDDTKPKYVRQYRKNEKKLGRLQRELSRKVKGSKNKEKARKKVAKLSRHIANCRKDYCHKMSRYYADNFDVIVLEDIDLQDMSRTLHLGKSVIDLGFGEFRKYLTYKCLDTGSVIMYADKWFASSKTCHVCGEKNSGLKLSDREWICPHCGSVIDRDYNAALNLRDYFFKVITEENYNTAGTAEIYASGEVASTFGEILKQAASLNEEEAPSFRWG